MCEGLVEEPGQEELLVEAVRRHRQVLVAHPRRADLHYRHGMLLRQIGDFGAAAQAFRAATAINPAYVKGWIKRALDTDHKSIDLHYQLGLLFAQYNRFDLAIEGFEASLAGKEGAAEFRHNLALTLQNIGMVDRADATWHSICELSPAGAATWGPGRIQTNRDARRE